MSSPRQIVLCFDGTGNTFQADDTETNVLRICRMLEKSDEQLCYYQPGIGTDTTPGSLASTTIRRGSPFGSSKTLELALGKSFDRHVLGGYRFLMRHYRDGAKIFIFGFSRGGYTARFLSEMLDYIGLLGPDNEEVLPFAWDAFKMWKTARLNETLPQIQAFQILGHLRQTLCRPTDRVQFLGMFDAVNSVAEFDVNVDATPSARFIRHAVSIDERRVKFRPVLLHSHNPSARRAKSWPPGADHKKSRGDTPQDKRKRLSSTFGPSSSRERPKRYSALSDAEFFGDDESDDLTQDVLEVWFPGGHSDVGGGWAVEAGEARGLNYPPLVWMVREAIRAGIRFSEDRLTEFHCHEDTLEIDTANTDNDNDKNDNDNETSSRAQLIDTLQASAQAGHLHDLLRYGNGRPFMTVLSWRLMEYLPFRRMDLQPDASWRDCRWPPPMGGARGLPMDALVHVSAIQRMRADPSYRPPNLTQDFIVPRGNADGPDAGVKQWVVHGHRGDPVRETYIRRYTWSACREQHR
ncbi:hypothetical protein NUU61_006257 [Penicillium alfredii]|uniref:T6SS Phospholipase effector Tle1-like catalytic domain-containing protein n=1 Tax=Penicillium alfredii TaxID=1506179 RepID=A0A9W9F0J2_9EURO|nr:uncharacterized protein NUU61_006257 [Penicillium alfredii]KAJ5091387.1 hypothetical protein NUU61_006257 [Penicillium alfredii]